MAEALVKDLTGGDRIRTRRMREDFGNLCRRTMYGSLVTTSPR